MRGGIFNYNAHFVSPFAESGRYHSMGFEDAGRTHRMTVNLQSGTGRLELPAQLTEDGVREPGFGQQIPCSICMGNISSVVWGSSSCFPKGIAEGPLPYAALASVPTRDQESSRARRHRVRARGQCVAGLSMPMTEQCRPEMLEIGVRLPR